MGTFLHVLLIIALVVVCLFVHFFNLDMKLTAKLVPLFEKHYDKIDRDKHL